MCIAHGKQYAKPPSSSEQPHVIARCETCTKALAKKLISDRLPLAPACIRKTKRHIK